MQRVIVSQIKEGKRTHLDAVPFAGLTAISGVGSWMVALVFNTQVYGIVG